MRPTLKDQGYRFTYRPSAEPGRRFDWRHPLEFQEGDVDCTQMSDDEFQAFVEGRA